MNYRKNLGKLPYLTQCIKEGMRMHAPVPGITRELAREVTIGGVDLPRCTHVFVAINALHHNWHVWGDDHMVSLFVIWQVCFWQ